ncbi:alpha/beta fold hydrolase [Microbacterium sp. ISL-103]|uniref:alpha/beta fold hydrolase n=1 Tax=Microbacterium sp. ISL-103 TaxID=2819156 RepID=UPI001BEB21EE|nr:alpha/beta fold hydrolase [Microbacterium sp. ISL-103]MBT2474659.1 alpha/beta fold hydrolase [Microbacterium sp. ISL-103]
MAALTLSRRLSADNPVAVLALFPSLGSTAHMWDGAVKAISSRTPLDVLFFDLPGHGGAPAEIEVNISALSRDVARQIADLSCERPVIAAGVSMGGAVAVEVASVPATNIAAFASFNSGLRFGTAEGFEVIIERARVAGTAAFDLEATRVGWFTPSFSSGAGLTVVDGMLNDLGDIDVESYVACCVALAEYDGTSAADSLNGLPGLVVGGVLDRATPAEGMRALAERTGARYAELPGAHLAVVEDPLRTAALLEDLIAACMDSGAGQASPQTLTNIEEIS